MRATSLHQPHRLYRNLLNDRDTQVVFPNCFVIRGKNRLYNRLITCPFDYLHIPLVSRVIKSRRLRQAGHVARKEEGRSAFKILTGKPTGKRPLGRTRRRQENNTRNDLEEIGINTGNWVDSAQDRNYWRALVNAALNLRDP